jgi:hypothetical protein
MQRRGGTRGGRRLTNKIISNKDINKKSLLTSLCQREEIYPSLAKRGKGRFLIMMPYLCTP